MQRLPSRGKADRPQPKQSKSFPDAETPPQTHSPKNRSRSVSVSEDEAPAASQPQEEALVTKDDDGKNHDLFESKDEDEAPVEEQHPEGFNELPIEIQSLVERFLESLAAKVHPNPLDIDRLAELYQDFYEHTEAQIGTHISTLSARLFRDVSPSPSVSSASSFSSKLGSRKNSRTLEQQIGQGGEQQMLTASEISDKRRARKQLETKRISLEEAVERSVCEMVYPRIWRHRSTQDEERDEKLRSRAAALSVVGISLQELLSTALKAEGGKAPELQGTSETNAVTQAQLSDARASLELMNRDRYPLGKITHLLNVHKSIVEALQQMFPSSSSADEVLPALIYTIITSPPSNLSVVSNFNFIQRFRKASRVNGEVAYCLTNLEAAISFLETVDLSSIRPSEPLEGPGKVDSHTSTPRSETPDPMYHALATPSLRPRTNSKGSSSKDSTAAASSPHRPRRLSSLIQSRNTPLETASGAVLTGADHAFDTIHSALDGSFKFLFGRLREKQAATVAPDGSPDISAPKTLEDARKLVSSNSKPAEDETSSLGEVSHSTPEGDALAAELAEDPVPPTTTTPNADASSNKTVLEAVGGRRMARDRSNSSNLSGAKKTPSTGGKPAPSTTASTSGSAVESMRSLGNTFNPLRGLSGMGMMRPFSSGSSSSAKAASSSTAISPAAAASTAVASPLDTPLNSTSEAKFDMASIPPPLKRFVELQEPRELNFFDVELLLRDYQRLAGALVAAGGLKPV